MTPELYLAADKRYYETIERAPVSDGDFLDFGRALLTPEWQVVRQGIWVNFHYRPASLPLQGWKIHISAVPEDARPLFEKVAPALIERGISFKFLADARTLRMTSSNAWDRGGSGKFLTIYPRGLAHFKSLLRTLYALTRAFRGPYILSDRRYEDGKVLHYRYGGIRPNSRLQADGRRQPVLVAPDGTEVPDVRSPVFRPPVWARDPFPGAGSRGAGAVLNGGRYAVEKAVSFSNSGGVYLARDRRTGGRVVLKEARAHVHNLSDRADAAALLRHEFAILKRIEDCGAAPRPIELFTDWEHLFLAEEHLEGYITLRKHSARGSLFLDTRPTRESVARQLRRDLDIVRRIAGIVDALHARGVAWGDVSDNNILVHHETLDVRIIDLEGAHSAGLPSPARIVTPGYAPPWTRPGTLPSIADDYYAVGAVLADLITHTKDRLGLKPGAWRQSLSEFQDDFGLSQAFTGLIENLLQEDASSRPRPSAALAEAGPELERVGRVRLAQEDDHRRIPADRLDAAVRDCARFIKASADPRRKDRLFPADPAVYETNPLSLAHGAAGVSYALHRVEGRLADEILSWILRTEVSAEAYPPGLYSGLAGIGWVLLELGRTEEAERTFSKSFGHRLLGSAHDLHHGLAGWGMACLRFWLRTAERRYLDAAAKAGDALLAASQERDGRLCWPAKDGAVRCGLAYGSSGIGLFLLYLDRALGGGRFEDAAVRSLDNDIRAGIERDGRLSFPRSDKRLDIVSPYWSQGSAGIGIAALRFHKALGDARYLELVERLRADCCRKYTLFPGRDDGLAGIGEFLLDAHLQTGDARFLDGAHRVASGLELFRLEYEEGSAYPGNGLVRLSCDLATGSAGIMLFLDRLARPRPAGLWVDEVLS
ncbi:MAG: class III lanthionine synthetase LanKC [Elusimicrobiota bacterium]